MNLSRIVILRREYFEVTQNHCAAKLIEYFLHWTNWKIQVQRTEWIYQPLKRIYADLMGEHSLHVIRGAISLLESMGILTKRNNPSNGQDKTYQYKLNEDILRIRLEQRECKNESSEFNAEQHTQISYSNTSDPQQQDAVGEEKNVEPDWDAIAQQSEEWEETQVKTLTEPLPLVTEPMKSKTESPTVTSSVLVEDQDLILPCVPAYEDQPSSRQLEADMTSIGGKGDIDNEDSPASPSREEMNQVYAELRNLQIPGGIKLNETIRTAIRTNWQNVPGAIAFIKEKIKSNKKPNKSWEAWFVSALRMGLKGETETPTGFGKWYDWARFQGFVEASQLAPSGGIEVCLRENVAAQLGVEQWIRYERAVELLGEIS